MMAYWSYLLTAVGVTGLYLAGRKSRWGWAVGLGAQILWLAYAVTTRQWGFLVSAFAYGWVYARNFLAWRRERQEAEEYAASPNAQVSAATAEVLRKRPESGDYLVRGMRAGWVGEEE